MDAAWLDNVTECPSVAVPCADVARDARWLLDTSTTILTTRLTGFRRGFRLRSTYAHCALTTERADQPIVP